MPFITLTDVDNRRLPIAVAVRASSIETIHSVEVRDPGDSGARGYTVVRTVGGHILHVREKPTDILNLIHDLIERA